MERGDIVEPFRFYFFPDKKMERYELVARQRGKLRRRRNGNRSPTAGTTMTRVNSAQEPFSRPAPD